MRFSLVQTLTIQKSILYACYLITQIVRLLPYHFHENISKSHPLVLLSNPNQSFKPDIHIYKFQFHPQQSVSPLRPLYLILSPLYCIVGVEQIHS